MNWRCYVSMLFDTTLHKSFPLLQSISFTLNLRVREPTNLSQPFVNERLSDFVKQRRPVIDWNDLTSILKHKRDRKVNEVPKQKNKQLPCILQFIGNPTKRLAFVVNPFIAELFIIIIQRDLLHRYALVLLVKIHILRPNPPSNRKIFHVPNGKRKIMRAFHVKSKGRHGQLKVFVSKLPPNFALNYKTKKRWMKTRRIFQSEFNDSKKDGFQMEFRAALNQNTPATATIVLFFQFIRLFLPR